MSEPSQHIRDLIEASSLGIPEAKALRASVSDEDAAKIVKRAKEMQDHLPADRAPERGQA